MQQDGKPEGYVDFALAKRVAFADALQELGLLEKLRREGDELKGICPLHGGSKESFGVNVVKGFFNCFGCKKSGNVLDFVKLYKQGSLREAGQWLVELLERQGDRSETPAGDTLDGLSVREQAICRAVARYLAAVFAPLGNVAVIEQELGKLVAEEVRKSPT